MSRIRLLATAALVSGFLFTVALPVSSAPIPKGPPALAVKFAGEQTVPGVWIGAVAFIDETKLVAVGSKAGEEDSEPDKLAPHGAILDLVKKSHAPFTNGHTARIASVSVRGDRIATTSNGLDPNLRIWDLKTGKSAATIKLNEPGDRHKRYGVAWFHKSDRLAVAAREQVITFDPTKPDAREEYNIPPGLETSLVGERLVISPDDAQIASAAHDCIVVCWELKTKTAFSCSIASEGSDGGDRWRSKSMVFDSQGDLVAWRSKSAAEVSKDKQEADVPAEQRGVVRIHLDKKKVVPQKMGLSIYTMTGALDSTGTWLALGGHSRYDKPRGEEKSGGELRIYHLPTQTLVHREQLDGLPLNWVGFSPSGKRIAATTADGIVRWWDVTAK